MPNFIAAQPCLDLFAFQVLSQTTVSMPITSNLFNAL